MATIFSTSRLAALLTLDVTRFLAGTKLAESALFQLGATLQNFGRNLIRGPLVALGFLSAQAIRVAADFDELTAQLRAVSGGGGIKELTDNARRLGRTTKFTATEIQNLQVELAKLGFETDSIIGTVGNAANITQVFGGDLVKTGNTIAEVTRQFSRENLSASRVADVMAVAFSKTALNTENFAQAMKNVGSISNVTNNDFVSTVTLLGLLANAGQKSGIAGTRLKGVLIRLSKELGVTGREIDFLLSGQLTFNELIEFFRNRAGVAAAVIGELGDEFGKLRRQIDDSNGASQAFASTVEDRLFFNIDRLSAATEDLAITFGTGFEDLIARLAVGFEGLADSFAKADPNLVRFGANVALLLTIIPAANFLIGGFLQGVAALGTGLGPVIGVVTLLSLSFARGLTVYAATSGALRKVAESTDELLSSLDKKKVENVKNLQDRIIALKSELEAFSESDVQGDVLAIATSQFNSEIERLEDRLQKIDNFSFRGTLDAIADVRRAQILQGREINGLLIERAKLEGQITKARQKQFAVGGDTSFLGREVAKVKAQLEQELSFTDLEIAFKRLDLRNFDVQVEDLKNQIETADLSFLTIPQLEAEIIKYEGLLDDAIGATNQFGGTLEDVGGTDFFTSLDGQLRLAEIGLARTFGSGDWRGGLALLGNLAVGNVQSLALLNAQLDQSVDTVNFLNTVLGNNRDELERQQKALEAVVSEYADFGSVEGVLGAGEKLADLFGEIRKVTAAFGEQANRMKEASVVIAQYNIAAGDAEAQTQALADLVTKITKEGFDLASFFNLQKVGGLDAQLKFVKGLASAFRDLAVERLADGQRSLAEQANKAADALEREAAALQNLVTARDIEDSGNQAKALSLELQKLGRITELEKLQKDASTLKSNLNDALALDPGARRDTLVNQLTADLLDLETRIKTLTDQAKLDEILGDRVTSQMIVNARKITGGFGDLLSLQQLISSQAESTVVSLLDERAAGNTEVTAKMVEDAIRQMLNSLTRSASMSSMPPWRISRLPLTMPLLGSLTS